MSLLDQNFETFKTSSGYAFSAPKADSFGASEYTLVTIVSDISGSVSSFSDELKKAVKTAVEACKKSPRCENLLVRAVTFNSKVTEHHGYQFLKGIDTATYDVMFRRLYGSTALFDATFESIEAAELEAKRLHGLDILSNAIIFVITDGEDNNSTRSAAAIKDLVSRVRTAESIESINVVLIGVNDTGLTSYLTQFKDDAQLDQYVPVGQATAGSLARLAEFVANSVSSTSQALGTGGPSQALTF